MVEEILLRLQDDSVNSSWSKTVDSKAMLQTIDANPMSSIRRVSGEFGISQSNVVHHLHELCKGVHIC